MSRQTEIEHTLPRKADPDAGPAPRTAHRTSLTGLRRVAEAPPAGKLATATAAEQRAQHAKAESASFDGIQAALAYGAASIPGRADHIHELLRSNHGEGGPRFIVSLIFPIFSAVENELKRLSREAGTQAPSNVRGHLALEARRVAGAFEHFSKAWSHAQAYAKQHGEKLDQNPHWFTQHIEQLYQHLGLDATVTPEHKRDSKPEGQLLKQTIDINLKAAGECTRAIRMGMTTGDGGILEQDLEKLLGHLREIRATLDQVHDPAVARSFTKPLRDVLAAVHALEKESTQRPAVAQALKRGDTAKMIESLDGRVR